MNSKITELHCRAVQASEIHKTSEVELISILQEFDHAKGYFHYGASSLYDYCVRILKLSESTSYNLITVARKACEVPALKEAIAAGEITISKARKITPVLNSANQEKWMAIAKTETSRAIEKAVAQERPDLLVQESIRYRAENRIELKIGVSEDLLEKLDKVCDLESQRLAKSVNREEALLAALETYIERKDPIQKAIRNIKPVPGQVRGSKTISASAVHSISLRDQRQCAYRDSQGIRCKNTRWLEVHHIQPKSLGGQNNSENLTTLCSGHHKFLHRSHKQSERSLVR